MLIYSKTGVLKYSPALKFSNYELKDMISNKWIIILIKNLKKNTFIKLKQNVILPYSYW